MAPGEREKSEHKCRYQSRKMQRAAVAQGMLEKKTNSYHSKSRGSHPTEGRRQGGQLTSCGEGIEGLGEGEHNPKGMASGKDAALKDTASPGASADRQPEPASRTHSSRVATGAEGRCASTGIFKRCGLQAPCHPQSPRRK